MLKKLGAASAAVGLGTGVGSAASYQDLTVWIHWAETDDSGAVYGFTSKPTTLVNRAEDALSEMSSQLNFDITTVDSGGVTSPTGWRKQDLKEVSGDSSSMEYGDLMSEFTDQIYVGDDNWTNLLIYSSSPADPAKTGYAIRNVKQGTTAASAVVGGATTTVGRFKNTVIHEVGHTLNADHTDGVVHVDPINGARASPMITHYTGSTCSGFQGVSDSCAGQPTPTCGNTMQLSPCAKDVMNGWMEDDGSGYFG